jgi:hypothetical protein
MPGSNYCVGLVGTPRYPPTAPKAGSPQPQQPGTVAFCKKFYKVKLGQGCWDIQQSEVVGVDNWAKWNPQVRGDCSNLQANVFVCIGV